MRKFVSKIRHILVRLLSVGTRNIHWVRVVMDRETRKLVKALRPPNLDVLEISGDKWGKLEPFRSYTSRFYPEFDICSERIPLDKYDLIIAEQVFEHLPYPFKAGRNVFSLLRPGGHVLLTTPFLLKVHPNPHDCQRWTKEGIRFFLAECGFSLDQINTGSWGNRACIWSNFQDWIPFRPWFHSLKNEPLYPAVVWAMAKK